MNVQTAPHRVFAGDGDADNIAVKNL